MGKIKHIQTYPKVAGERPFEKTLACSVWAEHQLTGDKAERLVGTSF